MQAGSAVPERLGRTHAPARRNSYDFRTANAAATHAAPAPAVSNVVGDQLAASHDDHHPGRDEEPCSAGTPSAPTCAVSSFRTSSTPRTRRTAATIELTSVASASPVS